MRSKKAFFNIISNLMLQIVVLMYGFIVPKIIITNFGSEVNGLISSITQFLAYISLLESGFGPVVKAALYKPIAKKDKKEISNIINTAEKFFKKIALIFIIYMIILCFVYPLLVNNSFGKLYTTSLIIIISISTFAEYFFGMAYRLYLQADQKAYVISIIQIITYILSVIFVVVLARLNCSIQVIKLISGLIFVLRPIMQNLYVRKKYNLNLKENNEKYDLKQKWDGLAQHIAAVIHGNTDITILTIFCSLSEVSVYSVYYLVVKGVKSIIQAFASGMDSIFGNMLAKGERKNLNKKFKVYEFLYFSIVTIAFSSTMVLIVPFIEVYTKGITDANYIRHLFGYLIVISEYIWAIRLPYSTITLAAGHFKQTRIGAWIEAFVNIVISIILVNNFGIVGVAIGTIIAMSIRTIEFIYHTNKYILNRNSITNIKNISLIAIESFLITIISNAIIITNITTYISWLVNALIVLTIATIITIVLNIIFYRNEVKETIKIIKNLFHRKEERHEQN